MARRRTILFDLWDRVGAEACRAHLLEAIREARGNTSRAGWMLGISRPTWWRWVRRLRLEAEVDRIRAELRRADERDEVAAARAILG